ncbi:hypothetical protein [Nocardiopsis sp. LOL_012]|uniref:hypothetical protein n=1 Tax=Nocardiopsis sp. LOL_012 TaxID=3345409 RepID=UPI003A850085
MVQNGVTLIDYARTRGLDPGDILDHFTSHPDTLPEPVGTQAGQPTYDPDALDYTRGVTTLAAFAERRGLDVAEVRRWDQRQPSLWPEPVGQVHTGKAGNPPRLYLLGSLDVVAAAEAVRTGAVEVPPDQVTMDEYAERAGVGAATVKNRWRVKFKEQWPEPAGKRGRAHLYRFEDLERMRRLAQGLPEPVGSSEDLLTRGQVLAYLGLSEDQLWWREYRGNWPAGRMVEREGVQVQVWSRGEVEEVHARLSSRKGSQGE